MTRDELQAEIDQLEDDIACAEHDEEMDGFTSYDIDSSRCRIADLLLELEQGN